MEELWRNPKEIVTNFLRSSVLIPNENGDIVVAPAQKIRGYPDVQSPIGLDAARLNAFGGPDTRLPAGVKYFRRVRSGRIRFEAEPKLSDAGTFRYLYVLEAGAA